MTDEEREELIEFLRAEFYRIEEPEIAELADFTIETEEGRFRAEPRKRLIKMLEAFRTVVTLEDASTLEQARKQIAEATQEETPDFRILLEQDELGESSDQITFDLQDQTDTLTEIDNIMKMIKSDNGRSDPDGRTR